MELWDNIWDHFKISGNEPNPWWAFIVSCMVIVVAALVIYKMKIGLPINIYYWLNSSCSSWN